MANFWQYAVMLLLVLFFTPHNAISQCMYVAVCFQPITFELHDFSRRCLACWFNLTLYTSRLKVKVICKVLATGAKIFLKWSVRCRVSQWGLSSWVIYFRQKDAWSFCFFCELSNSCRMLWICRMCHDMSTSMSACVGVYSTVKWYTPHIRRYSTT